MIIGRLRDDVDYLVFPALAGSSHKEFVLLTEGEVSRSWNKLFKNSDLDDTTFERAEALVEELRATSPLRHRLLGELEELRKIHASKVEA